MVGLPGASSCGPCGSTCRLQESRRSGALAAWSHWGCGKSLAREGKVLRQGGAREAVYRYANPPITNVRSRANAPRPARVTRAVSLSKPPELFEDDRSASQGDRLGPLGPRAPSPPAHIRHSSGLPCPRGQEAQWSEPGLDKDLRDALPEAEAPPPRADVRFSWRLQQHKSPFMRENATRNWIDDAHTAKEIGAA